VVGFHFITLWLLLRFFSTTARSFYDDYFNYRPISTLNGVSITGWIFIHKFNRVILTPVGFCVTSPWFFSGFLSNHKRALPQWLLHLHAKFHPIPSSGLFFRRDRPSTFLHKKSIIILQTLIRFLGMEMCFN